jgi:hypothetical protein
LSICKAENCNVPPLEDGHIEERKMAEDIPVSGEIDAAGKKEPYSVQGIKDGDGKRTRLTVGNGNEQLIEYHDEAGQAAGYFKNGASIAFKDLSAEERTRLQAAKLDFKTNHTKDSEALKMNDEPAAAADSPPPPAPTTETKLGLGAGFDPLAHPITPNAGAPTPAGQPIPQSIEKQAADTTPQTTATEHFNINGPNGIGTGGSPNPPVSPVASEANSQKPLAAGQPTPNSVEHEALHPTKHHHKHHKHHHHKHHHHKHHHHHHHHNVLKDHHSKAPHSATKVAAGHTASVPLPPRREAGLGKHREAGVVPGHFV